jgi:hypothetical protein
VFGCGAEEREAGSRRVGLFVFLSACFLRAREENAGAAVAATSWRGANTLHCDPNGFDPLKIS